MKKTTLSLFLAIVMIISTLAGCQGRTSVDNEPTYAPTNEPDTTAQVTVTETPELTATQAPELTSTPEPKPSPEISTIPQNFVYTADSEFSDFSGYGICREAINDLSFPGKGVYFSGSEVQELLWEVSARMITYAKPVDYNFNFCVTDRYACDEKGTKIESKYNEFFRQSLNEEILNLSVISKDIFDEKREFFYLTECSYSYDSSQILPSDLIISRYDY